MSGELFELVQNAGLAVFGEDELFDIQLGGGAALGGTDVLVEGIFRAAHVAATLDSLEQEASLQAPMVAVQWSQVVALVPTAVEPVADVDFILRKRTSERFKIVDCQPDGEGMIRLILHEDVG